MTGTGPAVGRRASLAGIASPFAGARFEIPENGLRVGRIAEQNDLVIMDPEISRSHARLMRESGAVRIIDSSANGTYVNGCRVSERVLQSGDVIRFGFSEANSFRLELETAAVAAAGNAPHHGTIVAAIPVPRSRATVVDNLEELAAEAPPRLQLVLDQYAVKDLPLPGGPLRIGRGDEPGLLRIEHPSVSTLHAEVRMVDGAAVLRDLQSVNGTFVNGNRITEHALQEGDLIQLGACESHLLLYRSSRSRSAVLRDLELKKPVTTLGRDPANDIHLQHPTVSSRHAEIRRDGKAFEILDAGSSNGTFVNGARIRRQRLNPGDRIALGAIHLVFDGATIEQRSDGSRIRLVASALTQTAKDTNTGKTLVILDNISLAFEPAEFIGLLGPSGAGKSTLMDALNGSRPAHQGHVLLNGADLYSQFASLRSVIGYLPQEDVLHRDLTAKECLYYSARLRLPDDFSDAEMWKRVNEVVHELELGERANTPIRQLSGGQRKRVSLGIELLSKPALLFVDEPTAGQDPRTEMKMMQLFRQIANRGSTVIINTHLLGSFSLLDKVAVLVKGKMAFYGPSQEMLPFFNAARPPEIFDRLQEREPKDWAERYRKSPLYQAQVANAVGDSGHPPHPAPAPRTAKPARRSLLRQMSTLLARQVTLKLKDWGTVAALLLPPAVIAVLMGVMKRAPNEPKTLFMVVMVALWFGCSGSVREIVDELPVFRRERQRDLKIISYLGGKLVFLAVLSAAQAALFLGVLAAMGAVQNHLAEAFVLTWAMAIEGGMIGLAISAIFSSAEKALYAFPLAMIPQMLLAGLLIPVVGLHPFYPVVQGQKLEIREIPPSLVAPGMSNTLRFGLSPLMVSRWGMEAFADLYVHDQRDYSFPLLNSIALSIHPKDAENTRRGLEAIRDRGVSAAGTTLDSKSAFPKYLGILGIFAAVLVGGTMLVLRGKET